ncbi:MAG: NADH:ubiquinone oxidoreductase subunit NDUFA12 [Alphaproteobacteria bacterium]|nr:NADH:ubiquinone oxidoreductase subunit NDUFA12 [Alphaproteobacteria bacterium]
MNANAWTKFFTWLKGEPVGKDEFGNMYYRERQGTRRWVLYAGEVEASNVPAEWHAWLHHTVDQPPLGPRPAKPWEKTHLPNLTGSAEAYHPAGSVLGNRGRAATTGDYEPWRPN